MNGERPVNDNLPPVIETAPWMLSDGGALDVDRCPDCWERRAHIERYRWACMVCTGMRVLDFGCGVGYGSEMLARADNFVVGADTSKEALGLAMERRGEVPSLYFGVPRISEATKTFDACVAFEVLEHLPDPGEFIRTVPARHLIVSVPIRPTVGENPHHKHDFTAESFEALLTTRFKIVSRWQQTEPLHWEPSIGVWHGSVEE